jgi:hypothetical protein
MLRETGDRSFPIWLLGDSNPPQWEARLSAPFDPRHPVIHNIWKPVADVVQDGVCRGARLRVDTRRLYVRNAIASSSIKPRDTRPEWSDPVVSEVNGFRDPVDQSRPAVVFSFGAFAFEFGRRAFGEPKRAWGLWRTKQLGEQFRNRCAAFRPDRVTLIPLLPSVHQRRRLPVQPRGILWRRDRQLFRAHR